MINFENLNKFMFPGVGKYDIPQIEPVAKYPHGDFIPVNYHYTAKAPASKIVHFFVDDYQFIRFLRGYEEMMKRLDPTWVIFYGQVPPECDWNVIRVAPHYDDIVKRRKNNAPCR